MEDDPQNDAFRQEQEMQALKAIYDDGFIEGHRQKAWKVCNCRESGISSSRSTLS
jgi:hypothetical protein